MTTQTEPSLHQQFSSPSFSSYSSNNLSQIATKVIQNDTVVNDDFEFDFTFLSTEPVPAGDIFHNGQITPTYPLFDKSLLNGVVSVSPVLPSNAETDPRRRRLPLKKLMEEDVEELFDGVAPDTYCVWTPPCKKSSSTGSTSKRWKFRDLLLRSHSDGKKESLLFFNPGGKQSSAVKGGGAGAGAAKDGYKSKRKLGISWVIQ
ncbi:uncharacterized protein LOC123884776 [Trifolium pratense]|uniref:uncharacterized protein LOC123884776 n=1 Tax=Trifolium pratense TaxID=57577 RepID=UPI001E6902A8|nr:uncharacterized protein LOC123884776 [Trifolium pratense]